MNKNSEKNSETLKVKELKKGDMREDILPKGFISRVIRYKEILKEVDTSSLEEALNNFQRDLYPEKELEVWEYIAEEYAKFSEEDLGISLEEKKGIFKAILFKRLS